TTGIYTLSLHDALPIWRCGSSSSGEGPEMLVVLKQTYEELSREAAKMVASAIRQNPSLVLGLATGSSTLGMYLELVRMHKEEGRSEEHTSELQSRGHLV